MDEKQKSNYLQPFNTVRIDRKNKTFLIKTFGSDRFIFETYGVTDPKTRDKEQVRLMNEAEKDDAATFHTELCAGTVLILNKQRCFNGVYLFLQDVYYDLGLDKICRAVSARHSFEYDLNSVLSRLIYTRILFSSSKKSSFEDSRRFIEQPFFALHDIYRTLSVITQESDYIQSRLFKNIMELAERKTGIIYYNRTNFYFEIEQAEDDKQYGACKENRPLPIMEMCLSMAMEGIPIAFGLYPGKNNEQNTLLPLEKR